MAQLVKDLPQKGEHRTSDPQNPPELLLVRWEEETEAPEAGSSEAVSLAYTVVNNRPVSNKVEEKDQQPLRLFPGLHTRAVAMPAHTPSNTHTQIAHTSQHTHTTQEREENKTGMT